MTTFTARVEVGDDGVGVVRLVADQAAELHIPQQRGEADGVEPMAREEGETDQVPQGVRRRQDLRGHAAFGATNGLAPGPPFAPCPWRWTLTRVASTMAYSRSGSSEQASNSRWKTSALTQSRNRT